LEDSVNDAFSPSLLARQIRATRVLVFSVDDAQFCLHVDWVDAVYPRAAVHLNAIRPRSGQAQRFLAHAGAPALVVDLREAFDLHAILPVPQRAHYLVMRSGSMALALAVDTCVGVRELDLHAQVPVASALARDGGFPVAHIVTLDGKMLAVLDPNHLLDGAARSRLAAVHGRAEHFLARQAKLDALWAEIRMQPSAASLRSFASLCTRNGRGRAGAAARLVLKHLTGLNGNGVATTEPERLIATLVRLSLERRTGQLQMAPPGAANGHAILFSEGRIVNARADSAHGKAAFHRLLAARTPAYHFIDTDAVTDAPTIHESTAALAIAALEAQSTERRARLR
jgi:chemotaxis signal transduction protein